jgi:hypothetical protein
VGSAWLAALLFGSGGGLSRCFRTTGLAKRLLARAGVAASPLTVGGGSGSGSGSGSGWCFRAEALAGSGGAFSRCFRIAASAEVGCVSWRCAAPTLKPTARLRRVLSLENACIVLHICPLPA